MNNNFAVSKALLPYVKDLPITIANSYFFLRFIDHVNDHSNEVAFLISTVALGLKLI